MLHDGARGLYELYWNGDADADKDRVPSTFNPYTGVFRAETTTLPSFGAPGGARDFTWDPDTVHEALGLVAVGDMLVVDGEHRYYYPA